VALDSPVRAPYHVIRRARRENLCGLTFIAGRHLGARGHCRSIEPRIPDAPSEVHRHPRTAHHAVAATFRGTATRHGLVSPTF
jgi:hypothetical protein